MAHEKPIKINVSPKEALRRAMQVPAPASDPRGGITPFATVADESSVRGQAN